MKWSDDRRPDPRNPTPETDRRKPTAGTVALPEQAHRAIRVTYRLCSISRIIGEIHEIETIASGRGIRDLAILQKRFGMANWRKLKGFATVRLEDGRIEEAEVQKYTGTRHTESAKDG